MRNRVTSSGIDRWNAASLTNSEDDLARKVSSSAVGESPTAAGGFAFGPKGVPHTFIGAGPEPARALVGFAPMQFEGFMREVGQPAPARVLPPPHDGPPPDVARLAPIAKRNGFIILGPPGPPPGR